MQFYSGEMDSWGETLATLKQACVHLEPADESHLNLEANLAVSAALERRGSPAEALAKLSRLEPILSQSDAASAARDLAVVEYKMARVESLLAGGEPRARAHVVAAEALLKRLKRGGYHEGCVERWWHEHETQAQARGAR